ncbi:hypothetical protein IQ235_02265 [Oscillatoriales cyanobacterium LEGE 11467]|uniref:Uncharacterized protein n=1 Tax=Zarconia navalis LEGE 11467 TaxID=1828826 RepID=A0A928VXJ6_9CYAN|nr:hypothetical protein [Zarconia navalis]MBE9039620.1 hypothetical protein [Zarconia navalis LEGE 11467]
MNKNEISYLEAWNYINQVNLKKSFDNNYTFPVKNDRAEIEIESYFKNISQYQSININKLDALSKTYLENLGFSLTYLDLNLSSIIRQSKLSKEKNNKSFSKQNRRSYSRVLEATKFQVSMAEEGYITAICPKTGKHVSSNKSIFFSEGYLFYRFVSSEVFYLITGDVWLEKAAFYFPSSDLIITLFPKKVDLIQNINKLKSFIVSNWDRVLKYTLCKDNPQTVVLVKSRHFAHHLWNELSGIYKLYESNCLTKIDKFLVVNEPLGFICDIFPEIPPDKIENLTRKEVSYKILENNYFVISLGHNFIKEKLASRVYKSAQKRCPKSFLMEIKESRKKNFPFFWVSIRTGSRTWISQVDGVVKIIKNLLNEFPELAVVIDGFSLPGTDKKKVNLQWQEIISREQKIVQEITSLLPSTVKVYNTVGCPLYESIVWAHNIDFYLTHHGTIQHKVGWTANKPGVVHTNTTILKLPLLSKPGTWERENGIVPVFVPERYVVDIDDKVRLRGRVIEKPSQASNYECDWRGVYKEVLKIAKSIENPNI